MKTMVPMAWLLPLLMATLPVVAQTTAAQDSPDPVYNRDYWYNYPRGLASIMSAPARWDKEQWRDVALVAAVTGGLFLADEHIRDWWQDDVRGGVTDTLADISRPFGSNTTVAAGSLALYGAGLLTGDYKTRETGLLTMQGMVLSNITLTGIKLLAHRRRPDESVDDAHHWGGPGLHGDYKSFASGHAAKAFMLASVISSQYPDNKPLQIAAYGMASLTALGRVNDDRHWASDVVAGAAIGYGIGKLVTGMSPFSEDRRLSLTPMTADGGNGLTLTYRF